MSSCARWLALLVICCAFAPATGLRATTLVYQSTRDLLNASDLVVVGEVTAVRYEERDGRIVTIVTLKIAETWKGQGAGRQPGATVEMVEPGGVIGDRGSKTGGFPQYKPGDRVVSFLQTDPTDPDKRLRTTGGVAGRHLVVSAAPEPNATPADLLARPASDADCDFAGHDQQGRTALVDFSRMMRFEAAQKTTLDQFRAEVAAYQKAAAAGENPPLSARDTAIAALLQAAFNQGGHDHADHTPPAPGATALPPADPARPLAGSRAPHDLGPFVVVREEDIDRLMREARAAAAQRQADRSARDNSTRTAWIAFAVSGVAFVLLTVLLRRRKLAQRND